MKSRFFASAAVALLATVTLCGCFGTSAESTGESDLSQRNTSCEIVTDELAEYTAQLAKSAHGLTTGGPSTILSFHTGADKKLTAVAADLNDAEVQDAVFAVREASAMFISIWEKASENPDTWTNGSLDVDIAAANEVTATALTELGAICPEVEASNF